MQIRIDKDYEEISRIKDKLEKEKGSEISWREFMIAGAESLSRKVNKDGKLKEA